MSENTKEHIYDNEIAPYLLSLSEKCQREGLSFLAICEWDKEGNGQTAALTEEHSNAMKMVLAAMKSRGNIDGFMISIMRYAEKYGHSSAILSQLGVPCSPSTDKS